MIFRIKIYFALLPTMFFMVELKQAHKWLPSPLSCVALPGGMRVSMDADGLIMRDRGGWIQSLVLMEPRLYLWDNTLWFPNKRGAGIMPSLSVLYPSPRRVPITPPVIRARMNRRLECLRRLCIYACGEMARCGARIHSTGAALLDLLAFFHFMDGKSLIWASLAVSRGPLRRHSAPHSFSHPPHHRHHQVVKIDSRSATQGGWLNGDISF